MMKRPCGRRSGKRNIGQLLHSVLWMTAVSVAAAQDYYQGYRFAPQTPARAEGAGDMIYGGKVQSSPDFTWSDSSQPLTGPGGRPYRFRNGTASQQAPQQPKFRPDTRLGQRPKNWSSDPGWVSDPVVRQGLIFRPLPNEDSGTMRGDRPGRAPRADAPPIYPYAGGAVLGGYSGLYGPGLPGDPSLGVPLWPFPGSPGGWTPGW
jgi:hypothetical protein